MISVRLLLLSLIYGSVVFAAPSFMVRRGAEVKKMSSASTKSGGVAGALYCQFSMLMEVVVFLTPEDRLFLVMTNEPDGNFVVAAELNTDGSIRFDRAVGTRGLGSHGVTSPNGPDGTFSQGTVKASAEGKVLAAPGSNTLSLFSINPTNPLEIEQIGQPVSSEGEFPMSLAFNAKGTQACVLNGGQVNGVNCYQVDQTKGLVPIPNTLRSLGLNQTTPPNGPAGTTSHIIFNEDGSKLIASIKGVPPTPGFLAAWDVASDGTLSEDFVKVAPAVGGLLPFSMTIVKGQNALLVTDPGVGFDLFDLSTVSASSQNTTSSKDSAVPISGQSATCWSSFSSKTGNFYLTDIGTSTVTEVNVDKNLKGTIVQQYPQTSGSATIDNDIATLNGNDFMYVLEANATSVAVLALQAPGKAKNIGSFDLAGPAKSADLTIISHLLDKSETRSNMPVPPAVLEWVRRNYPKPAVDLEWIEACYDWIESKFNFDPATALDEIVSRLELQLLESDLSASMIPGTGLPANVSKLDNMTLRGPPVLVEIISITDIGSSAFNLQNIRQARIEQADLAGLAEEEDEEDGPRIPKYPRSMLKFELFDGKTIMQAIEYRRLPELELGVTPLGFKMLLKNVFIRRGIAFLEPGNVVLKGHETVERQAEADQTFVQGLRMRLGKPPDDPAPRAGNQPAQNAPAPLLPLGLLQRTVQPPPAPAWTVCSPRQERAETTRPGPSHVSTNEGKEKQQRGRISGGPEAASAKPASTVHSALSSSKYFAGSGVPGVTSKGKQKEADLSRALRLSPHRASPILYPDSDEDKGVLMDVDADAGLSKQDGGNSDVEYWGGWDDGAVVETLKKTEEKFGRAGTSSSSTIGTTGSRGLLTTTKAISTSQQGASSFGQPSEPICISDGDEKENAPAASPRVRKRAKLIVLDEDVIEISD
ncbi:hypothetical protein NM688_g6566 [Phlebia brevispora]|uniref:Uncharacterized protein n=1 Tax=Phlebia brevispora TaxID=194682 RepID=A0ACC1SEV1_9APHY|nr:hypothetical protein NM688_g6566 [Phlebia brevispora]